MSGRVVLLDGWQHRRPPVHWQGWLAERLVERGWSVDYPTLPDPDRPNYDAWSATVSAVVDRGDAPIVIAHGLSVLLWLRMCEEHALAEPVSRALLVAPPAAGADGGDVSEFRPSASAARAVQRNHRQRPIVVSTGNDPYLPEGAGELVAATGAHWVLLERGAHLNAASGYGPWPAVLQWCETGEWPTTGDDVHVAAASGLRPWLAERFEPRGHRLGILSVDVDAPTREIIDTALADRGTDPVRRHARLHPRVGETAVRAEDAADFIRRYGHEYCAAVLAGPAGRDVEETGVAAALDAAGVAAFLR